MNILSLFDGISGLQLALRNTGTKVDNYFASEIDPYAIKVTQKNFPNTVQLGSVKNIKGVKFRTHTLLQSGEVGEENFTQRNISHIDLMCGGSPCQSFSVAGNGKGFDDERGKLFLEYIRLRDEIKPKFFIFENVNSMSKKNKDIMSSYFGFEPVVINSALLTAQSRKRIYYVGKLNDEGNYDKVSIDQPSDRGIFLKDILESGVTDRLKSYCIDASYYKGTNLLTYIGKSKRQLVFNPIRLGNFNAGGQGDRVYSVEGKSVCLSANGGGRGAKTGLYKIDLPDLDYEVRKLTPIECERLQGFDDNFSDCLSNSQRYKALGNSFTVDVISHILKTINQ